MKDYIQLHYGNLDNPSYDRLREIVNEAWQEVSSDWLTELINTMHQRCEDVIQSKGGHTKW
jgi:hypothetical protein